MEEVYKHAKTKRILRSREPPGESVILSEPSLLMEILFLLGKIAAVLIVMLLGFTFMFGLCRNMDASMTPAVKDGDLVIFYRLDKNYVADDTLVLEFEGKKQVRRVIATAGDIVDITEEGLFINGALQQETKIYVPTQRYEGGAEFPLTVREGQVFVLGDSRVNATDSRIYGAVDMKDTLGKVIAILRRRAI